MYMFVVKIQYEKFYVHTNICFNMQRTICAQPALYILYVYASFRKRIEMNTIYFYYFSDVAVL